jgi:hypothetical protein
MPLFLFILIIAPLAAAGLACAVYAGVIIRRDLRVMLEGNEEDMEKELAKRMRPIPPPNSMRSRRDRATTPSSNPPSPIP